MFPQLSGYLGLDGHQSLPSPGTCVAICDQERQPVPRPQGSFIQFHLLSLYLRQKHPCLFFSLTENFSHLKVISAKCGFGVQSYADSGQLTYVSGLKICSESVLQTATFEEPCSFLHPGIPGRSVDDLIGIFRESVNSLRLKFPEKAPCVVVEDLSVFLDLGNFNVHELFTFIRAIHSLVPDGALILYATFTEDEESEGILSSFLFHYADWFLETSGLRSGLSSTIDGQVRNKALTRGATIRQ
jgi:hypothetical protein